MACLVLSIAQDNNVYHNNVCEVVVSVPYVIYDVK